MTGTGLIITGWIIVVFSFLTAVLLTIWERKKIRSLRRKYNEIQGEN